MAPTDHMTKIFMQFTSPNIDTKTQTYDMLLFPKLNRAQGIQPLQYAVSHI